MNTPAYAAYDSAILSNFISRLKKVKRSGNNQYMALCPAHDDKSPSLGITLGKKGQVVFNCLAGCSKLEILHAAGFNNFSELYPDNHNYVKRRKDMLSNNLFMMTIRDYALFLHIYSKRIIAGEEIPNEDTDHLITVYVEMNKMIQCLIGGDHD